ncbi:acyltransferase [Spirosoma terrae]|uniref:Acyltransferase n=1 Tax=Spirosoma terrae TaxID=1968276 RepID=A0A6L9L410_9BACT|nr:acyltransferase [Spirosoma terrae]NDU95180.1 acyltransferase [Spirosoma terrae]
MDNTRAIWLDYLRSFITVLVVAHHAALAYPTFAHFDPAHYIYSTAPVVDDNRWAALDFLIGFNDIYFMSLMFFVSGLFVYRGLVKKGAKAYIRDRFIRLGIPFLVAEIVLIPLAYWPSFYLATHSTNLLNFLDDYVYHQQWPVGPPWFIWLLLVFDGVIVLIFSVTPSFFTAFGHWLGRLNRQPFRLGLISYGLVAINLVPVSLWVGQYTWIGDWGPFDFQLNRLFFYFLFFLLGSCLGAVDWQGYFFKAQKFLGRDWTFWGAFCLIFYLLFVLVSRSGAIWVSEGLFTPVVGYLLFDVAFVASCLFSISACLAFFKQKVNKPLQVWDNLSDNAYGIYIVHYGFVTWLQFALRSAALPVFLKFTLVFVLSLLISWLVSMLARRISFVKRVI